MLLSCHHVLALMESQPIGSGGDVFVTYQGVGGSRQVVLPTHPAACDAAITRSPSSVWTPCDQVPKLISVLPKGGTPPTGILFALTRDGVRTLS
jgi:hypothetical protein